jgi:hypothetical protein
MDAAEADYVRPGFFTEHAEERWVERVGETLDAETPCALLAHTATARALPADSVEYLAALVDSGAVCLRPMDRRVRERWALWHASRWIYLMMH